MDKSRAFLNYTIAGVIIAIVVYAIVKEKEVEIEVKDLVKFKVGSNSPELTVDKSEEISYPYTLTPDESGNFNLASFDYVITEESQSFQIHKPFTDLIVKALEAGKLNMGYRTTNNNGDFVIQLTNYFANDYRQPCYNYTIMYMDPSGKSWIGFFEACKEGTKWSSYISPDLLELLKSSEK